MSLEEEMIELSTLYHGQRERMVQLESMLREYVKLLDEYEKLYFFRATEEEREALQKRAKKLLGGK